MALKRRLAGGKKAAGGSAGKRPKGAKTAAAARAATAEAEAGEISSASEDAEDEKAKGGDDEDETFFETVDEKRVRLAKEYLGKLGETNSREVVQERLVQDADEQAKRARVQVEDLVFSEPRFLKGHKETATCVCISSDESKLFSGGKDCALLRWDVETGKKDSFPGGRNRFECGGHFERVLSVCLLEQRQLLISSGVDRMVRLWDPRAAPRSSCTDALMGHAGPVSAVVADPDGNQVYSASMDKSLRIWDIRAKRSTETLLGHVAGVSSMDIYQKGRPLTGGADKTVRLWKVDKDTHLMFNRHSYAVDAVAVCDHDRLVSGSQDGSLLLWTLASKRPLASATLGANCWVTALGAVRGSNAFFSGAVDGKLRAWRFVRAAPDDKSLKMVPATTPIDAPGCINAVAVGRRFLACAVGKEHKFGRWYYNKKEKNGILLVPFSYREA